MQEPTGFFTTDGKMIHEGDLVRVLHKRLFWKEDYTSISIPNQIMIYNRYVGCVKFLPYYNVFALKSPINEKSPFREDLNYTCQTIYNNYNQSYGYPSEGNIHNTSYVKNVEIVGDIYNDDFVKLYDEEMRLMKIAQEEERKYKQDLNEKLQVLRGARDNKRSGSWKFWK